MLYTTRGVRLRSLRSKAPTPGRDSTRYSVSPDGVSASARPQECRARASGVLPTKPVMEVLKEALRRRPAIVESKEPGGAGPLIERSRVGVSRSGTLQRFAGAHQVSGRSAVEHRLVSCGREATPRRDELSCGRRERALRRRELREEPLGAPVVDREVREPADPRMMLCPERLATCFGVLELSEGGGCREPRRRTSLR